MKRSHKAALTAAAVGAFLTEEFYRYVFCRKAGALALLLDKKGHKKDYYQHRDGAAAALRAEKCERYSIISDRGIRLEGFYYPCLEHPSGRIAFIIHGYRSDHGKAAGMYYEYYRKKGFDLFCCDHGAAGESGGQLIGYDVYESEDCLKWLEFLQERFGSDIQVLLHGFSMGGATVLKMSDRCPPCVKFIVSDSGYSSLKELVNKRVGRLLYPMELLNKLIAGYALRDTDVRENLLRTTIPILFVHGTEDKTIPCEMGEELYRLCPSEKDYLLVEGARHVESMHVDSVRYEQKLDSFIEKYIQ